MSTTQEQGKAILHRVEQIEQHLAARYPKASRDGQLLSMLTHIEDEARGLADPEPDEPPRKIVHRFVVQPDLNVAIEETGNILVQLVHPGTGDELARTGPLSDCDKLAEALILARVWRDAADDLPVPDLDKPAGPACCAADRHHPPILAVPGCAQKWA